MEFKELIRKRRSIRAYDPARISEEEIREIVKMAQLAPSWKNSQTGRYHVALSEEAIKAVGECLPEYNRNNSANAAYIVSCFKKGVSGFNSQGPDNEAGDLWGSYDLGLQNAYLLLAAKELGYDTLVMGLRDEKKLRELFRIPDDEIILPVIAIGKGSGAPRDPVRFDLEKILKIC